MNSKELSAALFLGVVLTIIPFCTKTVINVYHFQFPFFSLAVKSALGIVAIESLRLLGLINVLPFSLDRARNRQLLLLSVITVTQALFIGAALKGMNIPMFGAVMQTVPFATLILSVLVLKKSLPSTLVTFSVLLITVGCLIAGFGDLSFDFASYTFGLIAVLNTALVQILTQKSAEQGYSVAEIFQVSAYNGFILCFGACVVTGEWQAVKNYEYLTDTNFLFAFTIFQIVGNLLIFAGSLCTSRNGAITTSLVAVLKNIPQTLIGYVSFGGVQYHPLNILGLAFNMIGAFLFTYGKYKEGPVAHFKKS